MTRPNFLIVGASKAGTTSLWMYLKKHPEIYMPQGIREKEPCYFTELTRRPDFEAYMALFSGATDKKAVGEASSNYLCAPESPGLIKKFDPEMKIIISLRNPVDRAFSLYQWMAREGYEWLSPFEKALAAEKERLEGERLTNYYDYLYFSTGLYAAQLERYLSTFRREQLHIVLFDDLKAAPKETVKAICRFLEVSDSFNPVIRVHNRGRMPFSPAFQRYAKKYAPRSLHLRDALTRCNLALGSFFARPMKDATRQRLQELYEEDIVKTARLIDKSLDKWLKRR